MNSHRDADHMRGIKDLHRAHQIKEIWDSGVPGTSTNTSEYNDYMDLRRSVSSKKIKALDFDIFGNVIFVYMNSEWDDYTDPNEQSVVLKIEYGGSSVMLAGDTNYRPWKEKILNYYSSKDLESSIFLASHHGSIDFFDDPSDTNYYYEEHMRKIKPAMTLISVGPNVHGLPDKKALELYTKYSTGSSQGNKVFTTEEKGTMKIVLKADGGWSLSPDQ
jgi:beta-lactamase superfamily II metal-dependent hydrolase